MLSRHADGCYWMGRCVERAEATARMLDVHYHAALETLLPSLVAESDADAGGVSDDTALRWQAILANSGTAEVFAERYGEPTDRHILEFFVFDRDHANSIVSLWDAARENARAVRELIASEMWECLNVAYLQLRDWNVDRVLTFSPHEFFHIVKNASYLLQGVSNRTLMLGETRDWLDAGRFLERGGQTARLLDIKYYDVLPAIRRPDLAAAASEAYGVGGPLDIHGWVAVLRSVSAFEMYRKTHRDGFRPDSIVEYLLLEPQFPASLRYCIGRVEAALRRISENIHEEPADEPERLLGRLRADLTYARADEIILNGLHEFLQDAQRRCAEIGIAITHTYLSY